MRGRRHAILTMITGAIALTLGAGGLDSASAQAAPARTVQFQADPSSAVPVQDQLAAALSKSALSGRSVTLPPGRFTVTRTLWLPAGSTLVLAPGATVTGAVPGQSLIRMTSRSTLTGGRIVNTATADCFDVDFAAATRAATIEEVRFGGARTNSVYLNAPDLQDIRIVDNAFSGVVYGVLLNSGALRARNVRIARNTFAGVAGDAVEINAAVANADDMARDVVITGNRVRAPRGQGDGSGFGVGLAGVRGFRVTGNRIDGIRNEAVHIEDRSTSGLVANNDIRGGGVGTRPAIAIYRTVRSVVVRHNSIRRFDGEGIAVLWDSMGSSRDVEITGNLVSDVSGSAVVVGGDDGTGPFTVRDNDLLSPGGHGVVVLGTHDRSVVRRNLIRGAAAGALITRYRGDGVRLYADNGATQVTRGRAGSSLPGAR